MKIAVMHDYFTQMGGAEKVAAEPLELCLAHRWSLPSRSKTACPRS